jgi:mannose-6-phosphate isomerase-like protein (cupin superfamily)
LRDSNEMEMEFSERLRDGIGTIQMKHLFKKTELNGKARLLAEFTIPAGASIGFHCHDNEEEIYYFLSGKGNVMDHDQLKEVGPGCALLTGGGKGHAVTNTGTEPLVFLAVILLYN